MNNVFFEPIFHNNTERLGICFEEDNELNQLVKQVPHAKWSNTHHCWHIPLTKQHCQIAYKALAPYTSINIELLEKYLNRRKRIMEIKQVTNQVAVIKPSTLQIYAITDDNIMELDKLVKTLQLKTYSKNTIELYKGELLILSRLLGEKSLIELTVSQIRAYILWLIQEQGYSESKIHTTINALKFYYEQVLLRPRFFIEIPRPKKPFKLPSVHSGNEVKKLINAKTNLKHKTMLMVGYGAGLRSAFATKCYFKLLLFFRKGLYVGF